jgi:Xaa-Pro dipeptidase
MELLPRSEATERVLRLQQWMQATAVDAAFILQNTDLYYFSGTIQSGLLYITRDSEPLYLVKKSVERAKQECAWDSIIPISRMEEAPAIIRAGAGKPPGRIGLEMDVLPSAYYLKFARLFPGVEWIDASEAIRSIRMVKSSYEIGQVRNAALMLIGAWERLPAWVYPGATEIEILAKLEQFLRLQGHQGIQRTRGFNYEVGYGAFSVGPDACVPTSFPGSTGFIGLYPAISNTGSHRPLTPGEPLLVDVCGGYGGYIADAARTFAIGNLPTDMLEAHSWVLGLNCEIESMLKPGADCGAICDTAFAKAEQSRYADTFMGAGDNRMRYVGHGVGLELDELPVLASGNRTKLQPGMTLAIEPKVFFPGRGGIGIENMYLITETGSEKITQYREGIIFC